MGTKKTKKTILSSKRRSHVVERKARLSQSDVPRHTLREALTVAQGIVDNFGGHAASPPQIALALGVSPTSSSWRTLTGAAVAYGLTTGAYNSNKIGLAALGQRATAPTQEGDDVKAKAEAALRPKVFSDFFKKYRRAKFPQDHIAKNVLQQDFLIPHERVDDVLNTLKDNGVFVGIIHQTKTGPFVQVDDLQPSPVALHTDQVSEGDVASFSDADPERDEESTPSKPVVIGSGAQQPYRVFITHGRTMSIVDQVKDVLDLYDIEYEVAIEEETTAIPVPQKVLAAMRRCSVGIMIVSADDESAAESGTINNNVLIEIGAAFVLYDQKVVLLWDKRLKVPSNLQGLYRCEFEGGQLSFSTGTKLAKAVKGFRN